MWACVVFDAEQELGPDHLEVASDCTKLGELMRGMGRLEDAEDMLLRALRIDETHLGPHHQRVAEDLDRLGKILQVIDRYKLCDVDSMWRSVLVFLSCWSGVLMGIIILSGILIGGMGISVQEEGRG